MQAQRLRGVSLPAGLEPEHISVDQGCIVSGLGRTTIYELIGDGTLDSIKIGKRCLLRLRSLRSLGGKAA
jgi:excisionase family DNA binding protein